MKTKKAFSFIELIVVVTIIAVISLVGVISYGPAQKKSRDSRRISDLEKIRMALEMVRQVGTTYPSASGGIPNGLVPGYLQTYPTDPKPGSPYLYTRVTPYTYYLDAQMEDLGSTTGVYGSYNYRVTNP